MKKIKIDKGVVIPTLHKPRSGRPSKYPFDKLAVGDSFFAPGVNTRHTIYSCLRNYNAYTENKKIQISVRKEGDGIRVWRIK